jgi:Rrf2 family transcriptional regulator, cysteine metabolism repressor
MKLSTRSRYGIRMMYELALKYGQGFIFLKDISYNQDISEKYLGQLIIPLRSSGLVISSRGAHGGYSLAKSPDKITLYDIVNVLEGTTCVVECVKEPGVCSRVGNCPTRPVWEEFDKTITSFLEGVTLESLVNSEENSNKKSMYYI